MLNDVNLETILSKSIEKHHFLVQKFGKTKVNVYICRRNRLKQWQS